VTFEIMIAVLKNIQFSEICYPVDCTYQRFGGACCPHHQGSPRNVDFPECGGTKPLWNLSIYVLTNMVSYIMRLESSQYVLTN